MSNSLLGMTILDPAAWARAGWYTNEFRIDCARVAPPCFCPVFLDEGLGRNIVGHLRMLLGEEDVFDVVRITIIDEFVVDGKPDYYVVVIEDDGAGIEAFARFHKVESTFVKPTRVIRKFPYTGAVQQFLSDFHKHGYYFVAQGCEEESVSGPMGEAEVRLETWLLKRLLEFQHFEEKSFRERYGEPRLVI